MSNPYRVQNPMTNEVVETFDHPTEEQVQEILAKSDEAFQSWRQRWRPNRYWASAAPLKARLEGLRDRQLIPEEELTALIRLL